MLVSTKEEHGFIVYTFTDNNTDYEVLTDDGQKFMVYSQRKSLSKRTTPKCYDSLEDMASRAKSKAVKNLATLISV